MQSEVHSPGPVTWKCYTSRVRIEEISLSSLFPTPWLAVRKLRKKACQLATQVLLYACKIASSHAVHFDKLPV